MKAGVVAVLVVVSSGMLAAQWLGQPSAGIPRTADGKPNLTAPPPRASDGKPDLSGLWTKTSPKYARNIVADLKPEDLRPATRETVNRHREDLGKDGMQVRCLPLGPAYATSGDSTGSEMMRIVQTPQLIVMLNPDLTYRQIWMDGRALEANPNPSWMGYSVGRWEGETLVVESYGFPTPTNCASPSATAAPASGSWRPRSPSPIPAPTHGRGPSRSPPSTPPTPRCWSGCATRARAAA
jgi:hypothetical protein